MITVYHESWVITLVVVRQLLWLVSNLILWTAFRASLLKKNDLINLMSKVFLRKHIYFQQKWRRSKKQLFQWRQLPTTVCNLKCISLPTNIKSLTSSQNLLETNKTFLKTH